MYFCLGRHDYEVPLPLAAQYFEAFNQLLIDTVLPAVA
jgi:hypothetical protein